MSNWRRWVRPGLASTIVLAVLAVIFRTGAVERDLNAQVAARLAAGGHDWAVVAVSGRGVTIDGIAPTPELQAEAIDQAGAVAGVASVTNRSGLLPVASPYVWSAERRGDAVVLAGSVPSEATRNSVLAAARRALPDAEIRDDTELARGAVKAFNSATTFALERLADLSEGLVTITDGTLAVTGTAGTSEGYAEARLALREGIPAGVTLGPVDIFPARADPFVWSASVFDNSVTLAGFVPNDVAKSELVAAASAAMPGIAVIDNMNIASGEPDGFEEAAAFALDALSRLEEGGVMLDGLTLDIAGTARSVEDYEAVVDGVGGSLPPGLEIVANAITPASVADYGWSGRREGDSVVLTGYVPSLQDRAEVEELARDLFASKSVANSVRIASGGPTMDWIGGIKFAMGQLARLKNGSVELRDRTYMVEGEAADSDAYLELREANARTLPASLTLSGADILPPKATPYRLALRSAPDGVLLAGFAPTPEDRAAILDAARQQYGAAQVRDEISFASGAPDELVAAAAGAMRATARLAGGRFAITDGVIEIEGTTFHDQAAQRIASLAEESIPETFRTRVTIVTRQVGQPLDTEGCRNRLQTVLRGGRVEFGKGSTEIVRDSLPLLDRVAGILMRCPVSAVEIGGHSDSDGSEQNNLQLTQARADAVLDYLVDAGVRFERMTAVGYGEAQPIADNATEAGKAANRRIEFTVSLPNEG